MNPSSDRPALYDGRHFDPNVASSSRERAELHAQRAERLLQGFRSGSYVVAPPTMAVAAVHAQLAVAFATLAAAEGDR